MSREADKLTQRQVSASRRGEALYATGYRLHTPVQPPVLCPGRNHSDWPGRLVRLGLTAVVQSTSVMRRERNMESHNCRWLRRIPGSGSSTMLLSPAKHCNGPLGQGT
ncbi:hypothetical protein RRG08_037565 [Elysia crispata]|uniref:Uncharacterized protein n=1 Tax=Elysia crispata TaxID=231223 RepID=A0AAE0Y7L4_9GAST|nr:hypothetical protein RRG08_037565 [Elysia crispata]